MGIRDIDRGARVFLARLRGLSEGAKLTMGVHPDVGLGRHPSNRTIAGVAGIVELGMLERAPAGFVRVTIDQQRSTFAKRLATAGARVLKKGGGQIEAFGPVAAEVAADMAAKVPVDTGTIRDSVEARVNGVKVNALG